MTKQVSVTVDTRRYARPGSWMQACCSTHKATPHLVSRKKSRGIVLARAVGFEPTANRFTLLPRLLAVSDYVFTLGVTVRVSGARGWVIGWAPHHLVSTPSRLAMTLRLAWLGVAPVTTR